MHVKRLMSPELMEMTERELRKLSRADLLQMLIDQSEELNTLRKKYAAAESALAKKELMIDEAGSLADAVFKLNGIFESAQTASQQYLDNLKALSHRREVLCVQRENECLEKVGRLLAETEKRCAKMEKDAKVRSAEIIAKAKAESQQYWEEIYAKLDAYYEQHIGIRELLSIINSENIQIK